MTDHGLLSKISICLVDTLYAGNIGSVARAMKNTGLSKLILVNTVDPDCEETRQMASGNYDIIENAKRFDSYEEALAPFELTIGTSRRLGKSRKATHLARNFPEFLLPMLEQNEAVIVFGNEKSGLTTEQLDLCRHTVMIPACDDCASLNLSQAVLIIAYEIWIASGETEFPTFEKKLAPTEDLERMFDHFRRVLLETGFLDSKNPAWIMRAFRSIFARAGLNVREIKILRGMLSDFEWYLDHCIEAGKRDGPREN